ncbi:MATE efflux family protein [Spizellomyces punctatus DAOM BR117]|uniref:MATE efflux family protein n=1 Tax=Spizellomyces punctatus (strain DAOM BR117) TaxID=645134 RepID=A0A0L0HP53_SPIPD|nr:MATE efflux family protein [Spizellomyces punctatus DAOM BR117]KND02745.1 MATE efflux family protein [Spizellomyces punctatus DAOM BR117]|eukprot:XP_016610784.1 MATE efflux family protein [Spizellomyces punctatus DAOM BR117]
MFVMVTGWVMALGSTPALDTLCSQSWTGAEDRHEVGIHLQRALMILSLMYIPIALLWFFAEPVLLALGQEPELSRMSALFMRWLILGAPGYIYFEAIKKYLQAQGIMHASTLVLMIASPLNLLYLYLLVPKLGFIGGAIAICITYWSMLILLIGYAVLINGSEGWGGWSRKSLQQWGTFLKLAIAGILMVGSEWIAFEIVAILAGWLGTVPLAAQSVVMTADQILNTIPFGISIATSNRVGNLLGLGCARRARMSSYASAFLAATMGTIMLITLMLSRTTLPLLFSSSPEVVDLVARVLPYVALFQIADGLANACGGALRGMGRQKIGAWCNLIGYYVLALPMGVALAFKGRMGLIGLWVGQCAALCIVGVLELGVISLGTNWRKEVELCKKRVAMGEICGGH